MDNFAIREDWLSGPIGECGERAVGSAFSVVRTAEDGRRWVSPEGWRTRFECDDDGFPVVVGRRKAQEAAEAFLAKVEADPSIADRWLPTEPMYGSEAWGEEDELRLIRMEEDLWDF